MTLNQDQILPSNPMQALQEMIRITSKIIDVSHEESQAIALGDLMGFTILQGNKENIADKYVLAGNEFRARADEFKGVDETSLNKLRNMQSQLGQILAANNKAIEPVVEKARSKIKVKTDDAN